MTAGAPTKYNEVIGGKLATLLTHMTAKEACKEVGICERTYYSWLYKHPEFLQLSTQARKIKGINHYQECEHILEEIKDAKKNEDIRVDVARLRLDFHLRLAGKANQGLFGDKVKEESEDKPIGKVDKPKEETREEWLKRNQ